MTRRVLILESGSDSGVQAVRSVEERGDIPFPIDADPHAPSSFHRNFVTCRTAEQPSFLADLRQLVREQLITHVLPTFFHNAEAIVRQAVYMRGAVFPMSGDRTFSKVQDKALFVEAQGILPHLPKSSYTWNEDTPFMKPRWGKGSRGVELAQFDPCVDGDGKTAEWIFQEYIDGPQFTVDCLLHPRTGAALQAVVRQVHTMRRGTDMVATVHPGHELGRTALHLAGLLGLRGTCNMEFRYRYGSDRPYLIDINPRLSASFGMTEAAGLPLVGELLNLADGGTFTPRTILGGTYYRSASVVHREAA